MNQLPVPAKKSKRKSWIAPSRSSPANTQCYICRKFGHYAVNCCPIKAFDAEERDYERACKNYERACDRKYQLIYQNYKREEAATLPSEDEDKDESEDESEDEDVFWRRKTPSSVQKKHIVAAVGFVKISEKI